jgi:rhodanese-related sulfurtransferase
MTQIDVAQLAPILAAGGVLIDVREPREFAAGHVPGAMLVPMGQLPGRLSDFDPSTSIYLICASGNRSGVMCEVLTAAGFDAVNVAGGTAAWQSAGMPMASGLVGARA